MKVSQGAGNRGNEHGWKKWQGGQGSHGTSFARSGTCEGVRELNNPQGNEGADGWNMMSSDCVLREGSQRVIEIKGQGQVRCRMLAPGMSRNSCRTAQRLHQRTARVSRSRAASLVRIAGAAAAKGDCSCGSKGGNVVDGEDAVTS